MAQKIEIEDAREILNAILHRCAPEPSKRHPGYNVYTLVESDSSSVKVIAKFIHSTAERAEFEILGAYVARPVEF